MSITYYLVIKIDGKWEIDTENPYQTFQEANEIRNKALNVGREAFVWAKFPDGGNINEPNSELL